MLVQIRTGSQWAMGKNILRGRYDAFPDEQIPTRWENKKFLPNISLAKSTAQFQSVDGI